MASDASPAEWYRRPPEAFDIVTCYFPETNASPEGIWKLRPALILSVKRKKNTGEIAVVVAYGTSALKLTKRENVDLIIQNATDMRIMGLPKATRFDLDNTVVLPWCPPYFAPWSGYQSPLLGSLTVEYAKDLVWLMHKRQQS